jgi:CO dehydrogenase maturation factor
MKIAFVGKGGSGKTTLSSLFVRRLAAAGRPVLAVDADINQHLGTALGLTDAQAETLPSMGAHLPQIKEYLRGSNPRIPDAASMIKTTPPGRGSRLLRVVEDNPLYELCARPLPVEHPAGAVEPRIMATGAFTEEDLGVACYHSKVGAVELFLNHLVDGPEEYVVVDMTAGADAFASGLFTRFDLTFLVSEPTRKGVSVYRQYRKYAADFDVALSVVGNKVHRVRGGGDIDEDDEAYLREQVGSILLASFGQSEWVRRLEQGREPGFSELAEREPENAQVLDALLAAADGAYGRRDRGRYTEQMVRIHLRNAASWGNDRAGEDLAAQVDPEFVLGETPADPGDAVGAPAMASVCSR